MAQQVQQVQQVQLAKPVRRVWLGCVVQQEQRAQVVQTLQSQDQLVLKVTLDLQVRQGQQDQQETLAQLVQRLLALLEILVPKVLVSLELLH
jgi:hypothetical protein